MQPAPTKPTIAFRFNEREGDDADRFLNALAEVTGKRVTYNKLTGKADVKPSDNGEGSDNPEPWINTNGEIRSSWKKETERTAQAARFRISF
ncbi:MAG TPA: hypothetical protein VE422_10960 [Terriglobia bacterium]|nr:hypothetical protein [Terriglobia bacterium]